jgi:probable HAF family extracellular repeat protein
MARVFAGLLVGLSMSLEAQAAVYSVTDLGTLGGTVTEGLAINSQGWVTGFSQLTGSTDYHAFLYDGSMHDLGTLGGSQSDGTGINDSGRVAGFSQGGEPYHAFSFDGTLHDLGTLGGPFSVAYDLTTMV